MTSALLLPMLALLAGGCGRDVPAPTGGAALYQERCASCHGPQGRGDGPAATTFDPRPTDLTAIETDVPELMRIIDGRRTVRAHGSSAMPVWGEVFQSALQEDPHTQRTVLQKVQALADHVSRLRSR